MTRADQKVLFDRWAELYDTAEKSDAEEAAYKAYSLAAVDRRAPACAAEPDLSASTWAQTLAVYFLLAFLFLLPYLLFGF